MGQYGYQWKDKVNLGGHEVTISADSATEGDWTHFCRSHYGLNFRFIMTFTVENGAWGPMDKLIVIEAFPNCCGILIASHFADGIDETMYWYVKDIVKATAKALKIGQVMLVNYTHNEPFLQDSHHYVFENIRSEKNELRVEIIEVAKWPEDIKTEKKTRKKKAPSAPAVLPIAVPTSG